MSSDLQRESSFRSAIKNQKRRLSATKLPSKPLTVPEPNTHPTSQLKPVKLRSGSLGSNQLIRSLKHLGKSDSLPETDDDEEFDSLGLDDSFNDSLSRNDENMSSRDSTPGVLHVDTELPQSPRLLAPPSPFLPRTPSPLVLDECSTPPMGRKEVASRAISPDGRGRSPVPPDSPLLCPPSPQVKRVREMHREIRRQRSFRRSIERSR